MVIRFPGCCGPCFRVLFQLKVFQLSYIFEDVVLYCGFVELFFVVVVLIWFLCKKKIIYMKMNCSCIVLVLYFQECLRLPSFFFYLVKASCCSWGFSMLFLNVIIIWYWGTVSASLDVSGVSRIFGLLLLCFSSLLKIMVTVIQSLKPQIFQRCGLPLRCSKI